MSYFDENLKSLNISELAIETTTVHFILHEGIVVEGFKKIFELSENKITLALKTGETLIVTGDKLEVKEIAKGEISVAGEIYNIQVK